jgi:hypothetical protein
MSQPANTFDSYDVKGIREDLENVIYDISPEETPFYSSLKKVKASNTYHEWQTDSLRSSAANAHIEGDDTAGEARTATTRLGNYTQIFKNAVIIPDTDEGLDKAGRAAEMAYQVLKIAKEQKLDIEKALFDNNKYEVGSATAARELAGCGAYVSSNVANIGGSGGANPTGSVPGNTARTDGTATVFSQADFDTVMQGIWESGGNPDTVYLSAFQMNKALEFTGYNNQRSHIEATSKTVVKAVDIYVTPWGPVEFTPSRENRGRDVWIMDSDMWAVGVLRPTKNTELAKTGDSTKRQVLTELTLISKNEAASGLVADCTTS